MWFVLISGFVLSVFALRDIIKDAPVENPKPRIAWDMEPFSKEVRWRVIVPETRGTVVVNEATIKRLEQVL